MRWRLIFAAAVSGVMLLAAGVPATAGQVFEYVGLGDSYSSGTGTSGAQGECLRSPQAYGPLYAQQAGLTFRQAACSGAQTYDVPEYQARHLSTQTRLVTVTVGGNDAGFVPILKACIGLYIVTDCLNTVDVWTGWAEAGLAPLLDAVYADIIRRAPWAVLVVLGYPYLFDAEGTCLAAGMPRASQDAVNDYTDTLNGIIAERAIKAGALWADVREAFTGHGVCAGDTWLVGLRLSRAAYHPNERGHEMGYLAVLSGVLAQPRDYCEALCIS